MEVRDAWGSKGQMELVVELKKNIYKNGEQVEKKYKKKLRMLCWGVLIGKFLMVEN